MVPYLDDEEDSDPYSSLSDRQPLEDPSMGKAPSVKDYIAQRKGIDFQNDPLMKQYNQEQDELNQYREDLSDRQKDQLQTMALGSIASTLARGASAPEEGNDVAQSIASMQSQQNKAMLQGKEQDLERRRKVMEEIAGRDSKEKIAAENRKMREAALQASENQKNATRNVQINRLLGQTEKELREDPIAKPSEMNLASLQKSKMILENTSVPLTPQMLSDAEQDIASALALRGQGATEGKIQRTELVTMGRKIAEAKQKWGNQIVDLRKSDPQLVAQIVKMNQALMDDYKTTIAQRKHSILDDKESIFGDDPAFSGKLKALRASVSKRYGQPETPEQEVGMAKNYRMPPGNPDHPEAGAAYAAGGHPELVRKLYSPSRNQTKLIYKDGSEVTVDGKQ